MTAISKLQFSPFRANFCRGWAKPLIYRWVGLGWVQVWFLVGHPRVAQLADVLIQGAPLSALRLPLPLLVAGDAFYPPTHLCSPHLAQREQEF